MVGIPLQLRKHESDCSVGIQIWHPVDVGRPQLRAEEPPEHHAVFSDIAHTGMRERIPGIGKKWAILGPAWLHASIPLGGGIPKVTTLSM